MESTDVFRIKWCWNVPKIIEFGSVFRGCKQKMWAFTCCGIDFFGPTLYATALCLSGCLSQAGILLKWLNGSSSFYTLVVLHCIEGAFDIRQNKDTSICNCFPYCRLLHIDHHKCCKLTLTDDSCQFITLSFTYRTVWQLNVKTVQYFSQLQLSACVYVCVCVCVCVCAASTMSYHTRWWQLWRHLVESQFQRTADWLV